MKKSAVNPWLVVLGTVIVQMGLGTIYTWSLFNQPLVSKYGWGLNAVAITFSITSLSLAFSTLFASKLQEKWGLRKLIMIAGLALGLGLILSSQASSLILLYVLAGVVVGYADGTAYITSLSNLIKWFPERKGLIAGISVSAYGSGSLIFKYVNAQLIESVGVSQAFIYWGLIVTAMIILGACLIHQAADQGAVQESKTHEYTTKEMLGTKQVYLLFIMLFTSCMSGLYLIGMVKDIGVQLVGLSAATAANAVAMVAIFNTLGRIILGPLSDKIGRLKIVTGTFVVMASSVLVLSFVDLNYGIYFVCVASVAFCFGGNITIFPAIVGDFFGMKNHSKNYGIVYQGFGFGALAGSFIGALLGGFKPTFMVIGVLCVVSFIIAILIQAPKQKKEQEEEYRSVA
ncbi:oxalate/formate antiport family MFS transporter [Bacillus cereus]|uniref:Oxalate/formate antiport family MFS transporter n=1 Tax=Bacillus cereus TaxID=1396 RepID=A0A2B1CM40_BACCE|nr:OFA family MFS transporter [Bacillus cereus]PEC86771.1 oxalate/formate antiport family MFS transporter [Bacillus cereus]PEX36927.1 oxalate/formate antiport family MFS transporter [Bacillus cereus]PFB12055.1 oxalate/formate antiport family MFS transporter [Bacillus cereus]PFB70775.1 oxalate/formate antiport family MFS transporter [Bacillus cereus]PFC75471.1 oxalate/formate antiport family MFS transporter [Bacillus cereus]